MRKRPLSARKQMKAVVQFRDEVAESFGMPPRSVERLTERLAPVARKGGGTESDVLVLLHRIAHHHQLRPYDFDYILGSTFQAVDDLTLVGVHGLPLKALVQDASPLVRVCVGLCELLWPNQWAKHQEDVERRNLQVEHARLTATAVLSTEAQELEQVRERMGELGVEPDPELVEQARRQRDAQGMPAPPWEQ